MCRTRSLGGRLAALLALVLQLALAAALPQAHARIEAAEFSHQVHIETEGKGACLPHNDFDCQICRQQQITDFTAAAGTVAASPLIHASPQLSGGRLNEPAAVPNHAPLGPRAPPLV